MDKDRKIEQLEGDLERLRKVVDILLTIGVVLQLRKISILMRRMY